MKRILPSLCGATFLMTLYCSCSETDRVTNSSSGPSHVEIKQVEGRYLLHVDNKPFFVQGVGMEGVGSDSRIRLLKESGGNSLRTWEAQNGQQILDSAAKYDLMVAMGLGMGKELHGFDYDDDASVQKQFGRMKAAVDRYKDHPNLLCWVPGNELNLFFGEDGGLAPVNPKTYLALDKIVDYIHEVDPHHPVTTTFAGVDQRSIEYALKYSPDLDFLSFQAYGGLGVIPSAASEAGVKIPYLITEYGPIGHWERPATEWGREIEETSTEKAVGLAQRMQQAFIDDNDGLNMGGYAFLWGQKQERTPTWYGMFNKSGEATAMVDELARIWTGSYPQNRAPKVDSMSLDRRKATDNIYLKPNTEYSAKVFVSDPDDDQLTYKWVIMKEVEERSQGGAREIEPEYVDLEIVADSEGELVFVSPEEPTDYRLFSYVYDGNGKVGNANVPFYVQ